MNVGTYESSLSRDEEDGDSHKTPGEDCVTYYRSTTAANAKSSALVVDGYVGGRLTNMLVDTGSDVSIIRKDVWEVVCSTDCHLQRVPDAPVMVATEVNYIYPYNRKIWQRFNLANWRNFGISPN